MDESCQRFVDSVIERNPGLQAVYREIVAYWEPDEPPITTLFGALGDRIAEDFDCIGMALIRQIFSLVEVAMASGDRKLRTAVATGLIEGLVARAARQEGLWLRISPMLGELSLKHAEAWLGD